MLTSVGFSTRPLVSTFVDVDTQRVNLFMKYTRLASQHLGMAVTIPLYCTSLFVYDKKVCVVYDSSLELLFASLVSCVCVRFTVMNSLKCSIASILAISLGLKFRSVCVTFVSRDPRFINQWHLHASVWLSVRRNRSSFDNWRTLLLRHRCSQNSNKCTDVRWQFFTRLQSSARSQSAS